MPGLGAIQAATEGAMVQVGGFGKPVEEFYERMFIKKWLKCTDLYAPAKPSHIIPESRRWPRVGLLEELVGHSDEILGSHGTGDVKRHFCEISVRTEETMGSDGRKRRKRETNSE